MFFFNDTATTEIYTLSVHDALPISSACSTRAGWSRRAPSTPSSTTRATPTPSGSCVACPAAACARNSSGSTRSEENTSELQSRQYNVCPLLHQKKNTQIIASHNELL